MSLFGRSVLVVGFGPVGKDIAERARDLGAIVPGADAADAFDLYTAVMLRGISWLFDGGAEGAGPGLQPYPSDLEQEIARLSVKLHGDVS